MSWSHPLHTRVCPVLIAPVYFAGKFQSLMSHPFHTIQGASKLLLTSIVLKYKAVFLLSLPYNIHKVLHIAYTEYLHVSTKSSIQNMHTHTIYPSHCSYPYPYSVSIFIMSKRGKPSQYKGLWSKRENPWGLQVLSLLELNYTVNMKEDTEIQILSLACQVSGPDPVWQWLLLEFSQLNNQLHLCR